MKDFRAGKQTLSLITFIASFLIMEVIDSHVILTPTLYSIYLQLLLVFVVVVVAAAAAAAAAVVVLMLLLLLIILVVVPLASEAVLVIVLIDM